jgi:metal transporter CNNM
MDDYLIWFGILVCITQSATFSGLNIALFSLSRLRLEVAADKGDIMAAKVLALRRDANFTLATILWGNVSINVLLTLLAESVLLGVGSFFFSTIVITFAGEIFPQAYFTRNALRIGANLSPVLKFYKVILWPMAKPVGWLLDRTVGPEPIPWMRENELKNLLKYQAKTATTELSRLEAIGAVNFLRLDDLPAYKEGEEIDPLSVISLPFQGTKPVFPEMKKSAKDPFLKKLAISGKKWIIILNEDKFPKKVLNVPAFINSYLFQNQKINPLHYCHIPLVITDNNHPIGNILEKWKVKPENPDDDVIDEDLALLWSNDQKRIISGSDILGRLMREIAVEVNE